MKQKRIKQAVVSLLSLVLCLSLGCVAPLGSINELTAQAADTSSTAGTTSTTKKTNYWKTTSKKNICYYGEDGKKVKGLVEINGKKYYFDSKGIQRTGWQKIDGSYYYFKIAKKAKGYMVTNKKVNGIKLKKSGKASTSGNAKSKLKVLVKAQQFMEKATKPAMTKKEKLKACWNYMIKNVRYVGYEPFKNTSHWDQTYANRIFDKGKGTCFAMGSAFAYVANACGYTAYAVEGGGHGWAEINGKIYDPSWVYRDTKHSYFGMSYSKSGKGGRRDLWKYRTYVKKI